MSDKPKLVVGRIQNLEGRQVLAPFNPENQKQGVLDHQKKMAALIAAAYLYRDTHTLESIEALKRAAEDL